MSGTNRLVLSDNVGKSESALTSALGNANKVAISILGKKKGKK